MLALVALVRGFGLGIAATTWWLSLDGRRHAHRTHEDVEYVDLPTPPGGTVRARWEREWPVNEQ